VDGLIAEAVSSRLAERFGAAWFRVLSLGMDDVRDDNFKQTQGIDPSEYVFGMNYPALPLRSEYAEADDLRRLVGARLRTAIAAGFRYVFVINHHGGCGQMDTLIRTANECQTDTCRIEVLQTVTFNRYSPPPGSEFYLKVGGHAGLAETIQFMAFYPDAADMTQLPEGPLRASETGILHDRPDIAAEFNPRQADPAIADAWGRCLLDSMEAHIRQRIKTGQK